MGINARNIQCSTKHNGLPARRSDDLLARVASKHPMFQAVITSLETFDVRFPTSRDLDGSDAMNPDPDYSAAYVVIRTDAGDGLEGHGFAFTIGRGNDVQVAAIRALEPFVVGQPIDQIGDVSRLLVHDSQLRWLGPEKGVMHMAIGAVVNALWDLAAKRAGKPLWRLLSDMAPEELVALVDFRYLTDALTPDEALEILRRAESGRAERIARLLQDGLPAYTTTPGWLGYSDAKLARLCEEALAAGYEQIKLKVGANLDDDVRRLRIAREVCGPAIRIAVDANQRWDVDDAVRWIEALAAVRAMVDRGADQPRRRAGSRRHPARGAPGPDRHRRARSEPGRVQAADAGRGDRHRADRCRAGRRGQREHRDPAARGEVRAPGVPPCRRGRSLRAGPAPGDVRLRRRLRHARKPRHRVRRPPARALRRPGRDRRAAATAPRPPPGSRPR